LLALLATLLPSLPFAPRGESIVPHALALPPPDRRPLTEYAAIWEKPLFRLAHDRDAAAPGALRPLSDYRLVGVVIAKDAKFALIERSDSRQVVTLHIGDDLDGRRVDDIRMGGVLLGGTEFLPMPRPPARVRRGRF
jgi:hypothetical protein